MAEKIAFNDNMSFNSKHLISVKKIIGHTTGISTWFEYLGWKSVILGKQCLHVLSKGTALHKAVGCC